VRTPGFTADASLAPNSGPYYWTTAGRPSQLPAVAPQIPPDPQCVHCRAHCYGQYNHDHNHAKLLLCLRECGC
jgi:hypothetical protein